MIPIIGQQGVNLPISVSLDSQPDGTMVLSIFQGIHGTRLPMTIPAVKQLRDLLATAYDQMHDNALDAVIAGARKEAG